MNNNIKISKSNLERLMNHCITQFGYSAIENDNLFCDDCLFWYKQLQEMKMLYRSMVPACTMENSKYYSLFSICTSHRAKMSGIYSLSTTPRFNKHCQNNRRCKGSICEKCFSVSTLNAQKSQDRLYCLNTMTLAYTELKKEDIPIINACWFRFEAFGDLGTDTQAKNYLLIAKYNPWVKCFAWWTKNPIYIKNALQDIKKPENVCIIFSSLYMNKVATIPESFSFIDKVFTVYDNENKANINCGKRSCLKCRRCYTIIDDMILEYVSELLK